MIIKFAKSSMLWSSIIFMFSNDMIKKRLKNDLELRNNIKTIDLLPGE